MTTTTGPTADGDITPAIHVVLKARPIFPGTHIVDTGSLDAQLLIDTHEQYRFNLFGPTRQDYRWQAREGAGFAAQYFQIDWEQQQARCPAGKTGISWTPAIDERSNELIKIKFSTTDCRDCEHLVWCVRSIKRSPRRTVTIRL